MRISVRDVLTLVIFLVSICGMLVLSKLNDRLKERLKIVEHPSGGAFYTYDADGFSVRSYYTYEEFSKLYPDEWKYAVEPQIRANAETKGVKVKWTDER